LFAPRLTLSARRPAPFAPLAGLFARHSGFRARRLDKFCPSPAFRGPAPATFCPAFGPKRPDGPRLAPGGSHREAAWSLVQAEPASLSDRAGGARGYGMIAGSPAVLGWGTRTATPGRTRAR